METLDGYLERLASDAPVPGGGSASALVGSVAAALVAMVGRIVGRNPKRAASVHHFDEIVRRAEELRTDLQAARMRDERAFEAVVAAQALPKATPPEADARSRALESALESAAEEPLRAAELSLRVLELASRLSELETKALISDVGCAGEFAFAALAGCAYNVRVNHRFMRDARIVERQEAVLATHEAQARRLLDHTRTVVAKLLRA